MVRKDLIWALKVYIKCKEWKVFVGERIWKKKKVSLVVPQVQ